jgi:hypothetical protein
VESELVKWFTLAEGWGAILLIDEADIFLERRKGSDISRNNLVSGKFTIRKPTLDANISILSVSPNDGVLSRASIPYHQSYWANRRCLFVSCARGDCYGPLDDDKRKKIWQGFFRKVEGDMQKRAMDNSSTDSKIELSKYAREYILEDKEVLALQ